MISLFYAGAIGIMAIVLAFLTIRQRFISSVSLGDGDNENLLRAQRAHGNFLEYSIIFLILSFALEFFGNIPDIAIGILGDFFILGRILHAYALSNENANILFRQVGILFSFLTILTQSIWAILISSQWLLGNNFGLNF